MLILVGDVIRCLSLVVRQQDTGISGSSKKNDGMERSSLLEQMAYHQFVMNMQQPLFHIPPSADATTYARRNAPPMFGIGLFAFVSDQDILTRADPDDTNGDGISGRANIEKGEVGRFGYKSQAASLESFNRGAIFNQMGITSDPLFYDFLELEEQGWNWRLSLINTADAQVSALDEPTLDDDGVSDPEISNEDQRDLLIFSTYIGVPRPTPKAERSPESIQGERQFSEIGCANCHLPNYHLLSVRYQRILTFFFTIWGKD